MPKHAWYNTCDVSIFIFLFLSYEPFLKHQNISFFDHVPEQKLNLICSETWPGGRSCLCDDIHQVEKYRPPLAPMHILSSAADITLLSCGLPRWHHPLNESSKPYSLTLIKWKISNKADHQPGPVVRKHQDFIIILGGNDISHQAMNQLVFNGHHQRCV